MPWPLATLLFLLGYQTLGSECFAVDDAHAAGHWAKELESDEVYKHGIINVHGSRGRDTVSDEILQKDRTKMMRNLQKTPAPTPWTNSQDSCDGAVLIATAAGSLYVFNKQGTQVGYIPGEQVVVKFEKRDEDRDYVLPVLGQGDVYFKEFGSEKHYRLNVEEYLKRDFTTQSGRTRITVSSHNTVEDLNCQSWKLVTPVSKDTMDEFGEAPYNGPLLGVLTSKYTMEAKDRRTKETKWSLEYSSIAVHFWDIAGKSEIAEMSEDYELYTTTDGNIVVRNMRKGEIDASAELEDFQIIEGCSLDSVATAAYFVVSRGHSRQEIKQLGVRYVVGEGRLGDHFTTYQIDVQGQRLGLPRDFVHPWEEFRDKLMLEDKEERLKFLPPPTHAPERDPLHKSTWFDELGEDEKMAMTVSKPVPQEEKLGPVYFEDVWNERKVCPERDHALDLAPGNVWWYWIFLSRKNLFLALLAIFALVKPNYMMELLSLCRAFYHAFRRWRRGKPVGVGSDETDDEKMDIDTSKTKTPSATSQELKDEESSGSAKGRFQSDFEVIKKVGKGAYGRVYHCKHKLDEMDYAVKVIGIEKIEENSKFKKEYKLLGKLNHPNIVRYYSTWFEPYTPGMEDDPLKMFARHDSVNSFSTLNTLSPRVELTEGLSSHRGSSSSFANNSTGPTQDFRGMGTTGFVDLSPEMRAFNSASAAKRPSSELPPCPFEFEEAQDSKRSAASQDRLSQADVSARQAHEGRTVTFETVDGNNATPRSVTQDSLTKRRQTNHLCYIQMEFCHQSLKQYMLSTARWKLHEIHEKIFIDIMKGLNYMHDNHQMFHRDIKPQNILMNMDPELSAKLGDFGLATTFQSRTLLGEPTSPFEFEDERGSLLSMSKGVGTALYCSPEQRWGRQGYGPKSDIFSVGIVMFEFIFCRDWQTQSERHKAIQDLKHKGTIPAVPERSDDELEPEIRESLEMSLELIREMVNEDPCKRPSAAQVLERLDPQQPLPARRTSPYRPFGNPRTPSNPSSPDFDAVRHDLPASPPLQHLPPSRGGGGSPVDGDEGWLKPDLTGGTASNFASHWSSSNGPRSGLADLTNGTGSSFASHWSSDRSSDRNGGLARPSPQRSPPRATQRLPEFLRSRSASPILEPSKSGRFLDRPVQRREPRPPSRKSSDAKID